MNNTELCDMGKTLEELGIDWIMACRAERHRWRAAVRLEIEGCQVAGFCDARSVGLALQGALDRARAHYDALQQQAKASAGAAVAEGLESKG